MFHLEDVLQLKDDEQIKAILRRHSVTLVPPLFLATFLIVLPFFLLFPLFAWGIVGIILFFASVLIGICLAIRTLVLWDSDVLIISNLRLVEVDQKGLLTRSVSEAALKNVQDVSWARHGMSETIFRMGTVKISTAGNAATIDAIRISRPEAVSELINDLRNATSPKRTDLPVGRQEKLKSIMALLETYPDEELVRVETVLKARVRTGAADAFLKHDDGSNA
jgi:membrane protein YdbS with pleckstrin-like domain